MLPTFFGLNIAILGMTAQRKALDVTAHNIANANTEGYSRQEALMQAAAPYTMPTSNRLVEAGQTGTGVEVSVLRRLRDVFVDAQIRGQASTLGYSDSMRKSLQQVELILKEPSDTGVASLMSKMWGAWQDLSAAPDSYAARAAVVQASSSLADLVRRDAAQLGLLREQMTQAIDTVAGEVNGWLEEVATLNDQIVKVQVVGDQPNDLRDRRELLLDKLAGALKLTYEEQSDGSVTLWVGSGRTRSLVEGSESYSLGGAGQSLTPAEESLVEDGELKALLDLRNGALNPNQPGGLAYRLDKLAETLIDQVNALHGSVPFFAGSGASDIVVNSALEDDPSLVLAGTSGAPGDGNNALLIAQIQDKRLTIDGQSATLGEWFSALVAKLGIDSAQANTMATNQLSLVDHLKANRESLSGVSLDEEAANMVRFERAYQASARVLTAMDEMLDTLINGMGVVGR